MNSFCTMSRLALARRALMASSVASVTRKQHGNHRLQTRPCLPQLLEFHAAGAGLDAVGHVVQLAGKGGSSLSHHRKFMP